MLRDIRRGFLASLPQLIVVLKHRSRRIYFDQSFRPVTMKCMKEVQASDAKVHLLRLLDEVERGETIVITRRGRPIARLTPEVDRRQQEINAAIAEIREMRKSAPKISVKEILALIHDGHRY